MPRFLHTADWQLGLRLNYVPGDHGASLRRQRFQTVERIAEVALIDTLASETRRQGRLTEMAAETPASEPCF